MIPTTRSRQRVFLSGSAHSEVVVPEVMEMSEVVVVPEVMKVIHRLGGQCRWHGKHRYHDSTSNRDFAEHDNPHDLSPPHHSESAMQDVQVTKNLFSD